MSHLIARILLTILLFPLASLLYVVACVFAYRILRVGYDPGSNILAGVVTWAFMAIYWCFLWYRDVSWTNERIMRTVLSAGAAVIAAIFIGGLLAPLEGGIAAFVGSAAAPLLWLMATAFIWREGAGDVVRRADGRASVVCPACGYNLAGLKEARCPECGGQYTLDELFARQPGRDAEQLTAPANGLRSRQPESPA